MRPPRMFDAPPDYRPAIAREETRATLRLRDHGTAASFSLQATPPPTYTPAPLFEPEPQPETGPQPITGQLTMTPTEGER